MEKINVRQKQKNENCRANFITYNQSNVAIIKNFRVISGSEIFSEQKKNNMKNGKKKKTTHFCDRYKLWHHIKRYCRDLSQCPIHAPFSIVLSFQHCCVFHYRNANKTRNFCFHLQSSHVLALLFDLLNSFEPSPVILLWSFASEKRNVRDRGGAVRRQRARTHNTKKKT